MVKHHCHLGLACPILYPPTRAKGDEDQVDPDNKTWNQLVDERNTWKNLAQARLLLALCWKNGNQPSWELLDRIDRAEKKVSA
jgi:hypothetical protein